MARHDARHSNDSIARSSPRTRDDRLMVKTLGHRAQIGRKFTADGSADRVKAIVRVRHGHSMTTRNPTSSGISFGRLPPTIEGHRPILASPE